MKAIIELNHHTTVPEIAWCNHNERAQTRSRAEWHRKEVMLSIWWNYKGVVYLELFQNNSAINRETTCEVERSNQSGKTGIGKSQRNRGLPRQCEVLHIYSSNVRNYWSLVGLPGN